MKTSKSMQATVTKIAELHGIDLTKVGSYVRLEQKGYQPLNIEVIGQNEVAVSHTYIQNGDVMRDPEMTFSTEYGDNGWAATSWRNDGVGVNRQACRMQNGHITRFFPREQKEQTTFANMWARNIKAQGWLKADCTRKVDAE